MPDPTRGGEPGAVALSRRGLLFGGASLVLGGAACAPDPRHDTLATPVARPPAPLPPPREPVTVERVYSPASGRDIDLALIVPAGVPSAGLPVCLALHWKGGSARSWLDLGLPAALTAAVRSGTPPFAVAAPDGEHYWIRNGADDPMRMLTDEVPQWLGQRGLSPQVSAAVGISMGGFGAWRYAREHRSLRAVATCSAALFTTWGDARLRKVFRDRTDWQSHEPLLHIDEVRGMPAGVWCGSSDPFAPANRRFARARTPEVAALGRGAHNIRYWRQVLPDVVRFLGSHLG